MTYYGAIQLEKIIESGKLLDIHPSFFGAGL